MQVVAVSGDDESKLNQIGDKMRKVTNEMMANDFDLWCEYGTDKSKLACDYFYELTLEERVRYLNETFGFDNFNDNK